MAIISGSITNSNDIILSAIEEASLTGNWIADRLDTSAFTIGSVTLNSGVGNDTIVCSSKDVKYKKKYMLRICKSAILFSIVIAVNLLTSNLPAHSQTTNTPNTNTPNTNTPNVNTPSANTSLPNMRLVLKNGAEVRGEFVEYKDGKYTFRLPDGRTISYPATEVDRMEALPVSQTETPVQATPTNTTDNFSCRTFITEKNVDMTYYTPLEDVEVEGTYGELAEEAREKGADAVIGVRVWEGQGTWSWTATYTSGLAVKWTDAGRQALRNLEGRCY